jgi:uncharacterized protein (TIGR03435 family)
MRFTAALVLWGGTFVASAQQPAFEVASIKSNRSQSGSSGENTSRGRLTVTNDSLKELIQLAFDVKDFQIEGPAWLGTEKYDIVATTGNDRDLNDAELRPLLQSLLAGRFAFRFHRETRQSTVYALKVAKSGPKMKAHAGEGGSSSNTSGGVGQRSMTVTNVSMPMLAKRLERQVGRTVVDETGLSGGYDFKLEWSPEQTAESSLPSIFTALQEQLGLRLDSAKGPVEIIVIDGVEKASEN